MTPLLDAFSDTPLDCPHWLSPCGTVLLINSDSMAVLQRMHAKSVNCVVTDPPYNIGEQYANYEDNRVAYYEWCEEWLSHCLCVAECVLVTPGTPNLTHWTKFKHDPAWIHCWYKPNATNRSGARWVNVWEPVLRYGGKWRHYHDSLRLSIGRQTDTGNHPCPKPLKWGTWAVTGVSDAGQIVLDPFSGSGTTPVACIQTGRRCIAIEIDPGYFAVGISRCEAAFADTATFFGRPVQQSLGVAQ